MGDRCMLRSPSGLGGMKHRVLQSFCSNPRACPDPIGGFKPKLGDARPKPLIKSIYQIHFINISVFVLKSLRKRFQFGASP